LAAIIAAVEASISTFCWMAEHPARAQKMAKILITLQIILTLKGVGCRLDDDRAWFFLKCWKCSLNPRAGAGANGGVFFAWL
jgi:hypothetical protein